MTLSRLLPTPQPPLRLTPPGVTVGAVLLGGAGDASLLVELDGYTPGPASLHRLVLPDATAIVNFEDDDANAPPLAVPEPVPDTLPPADSGAVTAWLTSGTPLAARGALVVVDDCSADVAALVAALDDPAPPIYQLHVSLAWQHAVASGWIEPLPGDVCGDCELCLGRYT